VIITIIAIIAYAKYLVIIKNSDYRFSEKSCNNSNNRIQQEVLIIFCRKLKTPFRINPTPP
jgi:hypothetical protein